MPFTHGNLFFLIQSGGDILIVRMLLNLQQLKIGQLRMHQNIGCLKLMAFCCRLVFCACPVGIVL